MTPIYTHDCSKCRFLGSVRHEGGFVDLYVCTDSTVVRHGNEGPQYRSLPLNMTNVMPAGNIHRTVAELAKDAS